MSESDEKRLLILDDEPAFVAYVRQVAERLGFDAVGVTRGQEFQRLYADFHPTLIVLDMVMPGMDGVELSRWLAEQRFQGRLLLITGYTPHYVTGARAIAAAHGLTDVHTLKKPIRLRELQAALSPSPDDVTPPTAP